MIILTDAEPVTKEPSIVDLYLTDYYKKRLLPQLIGDNPLSFVSVISCAHQSHGQCYFCVPESERPPGKVIKWHRRGMESR